MTQKNIYTYKLFKTQKKTHIFIDCISLDRQESVFFLERPQLVCTLNQTDNLTKNDLIINDSFNIVDEEDRNTIVNFTPKFDKKSKNFSRLNNDVEDKKNKVKQKKKSRSKMILDNDEIFIEDHHLINNPTEDPLSISLIRPSKPNKQRRKSKTKQNLLNNISSKSKVKIKSVNVPEPDKDTIKKEIILDNPLTIQQLSDKLHVSEAAIITWLFLQGISVTINQVVDLSLASQVAKHYKFTVLDSSMDQSNALPKITYSLNSAINAIKRAPIITIFGHVDHGKTTLLDYIIKTNLVAKEAGGITQSITGYEVNYKYLSSTEKLLFLDTPGHEAFTSMRLRGAQVTDIAILLVAADDGLKPQSIEAINYIMNHQIPYIVAINKIDKQNINIAKVKDQLANYNIVDKNWGGSSTIVEVSALNGKNMEILLEEILKLSEQLELQTNPDALAQGTILEAYLDKKTGPIANLIIRNGTLNVGDIIVSANMYGRIKVITNSLGKKINYATASAIVNVWGFSSVPQAGIDFEVVKDDKNAKKLVSENDNYEISKLLNARITLDSYHNESNIKQINLIIKTDMQGSIEAIIHSFSQIPQQKVQINILSANSGSIANKDIDLAITSKSIIIGFNIQVSPHVYKIAEQSGIIIKNFDVIYNLLDYVKQYMLSLIDIEYQKIEIGEAIVQTVFNINKGAVAGCVVNEGKLKQNAHIVVYRNQSIVYNGLLSSLKYIKDNVEEVIKGNECGVMCENYNEWVKSDIIKAYKLVQAEKFL